MCLSLSKGMLIITHYAERRTKILPVNLMGHAAQNALRHFGSPISRRMIGSKFSNSAIFLNQFERTFVSTASHAIFKYASQIYYKSQTHQLSTKD